MDLMQGAKENVLEAVGNTPIVRLNHIGRHTKADIYVKMEFMNPGGSMKDRIAINIIDDAEARGDLKPGGTIVEATSGNTGMGLALVAAVRGYKSIFVMPDKMSDEKITSLRAVGAKVVITPTNVDAEDPRSYYSVSRRIADETPNAYYANQYHNPSNPNAHYKTTGPEIWEQTGGAFDVFCAGMGTGGTLSGTGRYLHEKNPDIKIVGVDPVGSLYYDYFKTRTLTTPHPYKVEGIGEDFLPTTMNIDVLDDCMRVTDRECFVVARELARREGILCGGSGGASVAGAVKYAELMDKPMRILAHLPDTAMRYLSKYLDDKWMRENGFAGPGPSLGKVSDLLAVRGQQSGDLHITQSTETIGAVIGQMKEFGISQLPVTDSGRLVGIVTERRILSAMVEGCTLSQKISDIVESDFATVDSQTPVASLSPLFTTAAVLVVLDEGALRGLIAKIDLIEYMADKLNT